MGRFFFNKRCCQWAVVVCDRAKAEAIFNSEQYEIKRQEDIKNYKYFMLHFSLDNYKVEDIKNF